MRSRIALAVPSRLRICACVRLAVYHLSYIDSEVLGSLRCNVLRAIVRRWVSRCANTGFSFVKVGGRRARLILEGLRCLDDYFSNKNENEAMKYRGHLSVACWRNVAVC